MTLGSTRLLTIADLREGDLLICCAEALHLAYGDEGGPVVHARTGQGALIVRVGGPEFGFGTCIILVNGRILRLANWTFQTSYLLVARFDGAL